MLVLITLLLDVPLSPSRLIDFLMMVLLVINTHTCVLLLQSVIISRAHFAWCHSAITIS